MEKKKISKKVLAFGIVGLFAMVLVSALVVNYLSNTAKIDVTIGQPMKVWLNGDENLVSLNIATTAGAPISLNISEKNLGQSPIMAHNVLLEVTAPTGTVFTGNEFTSIKLTDGQLTDQEVLPYLKYIDISNGNFASFTTINQNSNVVRLMFSTDGTTLNKFNFGAGLTHTSYVTITTALGLAPGIYQIKVCDVDSLVGATCAD